MTPDTQIPAEPPRALPPDRADGEGPLAPDAGGAGLDDGCTQGHAIRDAATGVPVRAPLLTCAWCPKDGGDCATCGSDAR